MIPAQFDYVRPADLDDALKILSEREGEAKLLSGGYSLLPLLKLRLAQPALLVDLRDVAGLDGDRRDRRRAPDRRPGDPPPDPRERDRRDRYPLLHDVAGGIGDPQVRNWGTIGGSRRPRRPGVRLAGRRSSPRNATDRLPQRRPASASIAARDFFLDTFTTAIEPTEVLTEVRIPAPARRARAAPTRSSSGEVGDFATVGVAAIVRLGDDGTIELRRDRRDRRRRDAVRGDRRRGASWPAAAPSEDALPARPAPPPRRRASPAADVRGPVDYKRAMVAELTLRALRTAVERAARVRVGGRRTMTHPAHLGHRQRRGPRGRRRAAPPARPPPARRLRADRHPHRLRHEQLRRVHGPRRRRERQVVHDARRPGRRRRDQDDRGDGRRGRPSTRSSRRSGTSTASSAASAPRA